MPSRRRRSGGKDDGDDRTPRGFWSGTISFGLVSLPVSLHVAHRSKPASLRMLAKDGTPLRRRFVCSRDDAELESGDIVRGYELDDGRWVTVTDEELDALAPEKSQEIDLRRFVPLEQLDPMYFERAYVLIPTKASVKAYRLLARTMEKRGRAGIATFVMRGKEYVVAIIASKGILRAETLRFHDEIRSPKELGPEEEAAEPAKARAIERAIGALAAETLDRKELRDRYAERVLALVGKKLAAGKDVVEAPAPPPEEEAEDEEEAVDLMSVLKASLKARAPAAPPRRARSTAAPRKARSSAPPRKATRKKAPARAPARRRPRPAGRASSRRSKA